MNCTKKWLIAAASLILIGGIIFTGAMMVFKWDFTKLSTVKYENNSYEISEDFSDISLETNTSDIIFLVSNDDKCLVECYEETKEKHSVKVENGTLVIKAVSRKAWYDYIGINFGTPKITVYLPKNEYSALSINESTKDIVIPKDFNFESVTITLSTGDIDFYASASDFLKIKTGTGDISVKNTIIGALELSTSTGKIEVSNIKCEDAVITVSTGETELEDIQCKNLVSSGDTGNITLNNVIASEKFSIKRDTGHIKFNDSDANEILIETDTGNVSGSLLTSKVFIPRTDTGRIDVPKTVTGGKCEITTNTGNIKITVK